MCKNKGGKPRSYNELGLEKAIEKYFGSITITRVKHESFVIGNDEKGNPIYGQRPVINNNGENVTYDEYIEHPSVIGMCVYLGITRQTLLRYENENNKYCDTIKKAKAKIEAYLVQQLHRKEQVTGLIFNLKNNFGWTDTIKSDVSIGNKEGQSFEISVMQMTEREVEDRINELINQQGILDVARKATEILESTEDITGTNE